MHKYTDPSAAGYLLEAKACGKVLKDLQRSAEKYKRKIEKEQEDRKKEFETVMGYRSEEDIRDAYGWEFITEAQFDRYIEIFRKGEQALEEAVSSPTLIWNSVSGASLPSHRLSRLLRWSEPVTQNRSGPERYSRYGKNWAWSMPYRQQRKLQR